MAPDITWILDLSLPVLSLAVACYAFFSIVKMLLEHWRGPEIRLRMADRVWPVGHEPPGEIVLNVQFALHNLGNRPALLQRIELVLTTPQHFRSASRKAYLDWHAFLKPEPAGLVSLGSVHMISLPPAVEEIISVQCRGPWHFEEIWEWVPGIYTLYLFAWINGQRRDLSPEGGLEFQVDGATWAALSPQLFPGLGPSPMPAPLINWHEQRALGQIFRHRWRSRSRYR